MQRRLRPSALALPFLLAPLVSSASARAAEVWKGDMETGDLSEWSFLANPAHIEVTGSPVAAGSHAAQITLTNDATWPNGLKRVELNHKPDDARTAEGATTWFAWSFYLPAELPTDPTQQIGYWESNNSWQQMMAFEVSGQHISFSTRQPTDVVQWQADGAVTPAQWHRIALGITCSQDPSVGKVDVWFDGAQVVTGASARTLADQNALFTNVGLLRGAIEFADSPVIVIDDAVEGDSAADVRASLNPHAGGGGGSSTSSSASSAAAGTATGSTSASGSPPSSGVTSGAGGAAASSGDGASKSGCSIGPSSTPDGAAWALAAAVGLLLVRRRS
jgi:MYXO-CTERM domain-containing protein